MKKKKKHIGLTVFLILLVLILLVPVAAYVYLARSTVEIHEISALLKEKTLTPAERYTVIPQSNAMDIRLNGSDTALLIQENLDLEELRGGLEAYDILYGEPGLTLDEDGLFLCLDARWKNFLHLPIRIRFRVDAGGEELKLIPETVLLGKKIHFGSRVLQLAGESTTTVINMSNYSSVFTRLSGARVENGELVLTAEEPLRWVCAETAGNTRMLLWADFTGPDPMEEPTAAVETGDMTVITDWLTDLAQGKKDLLELKTEELAYSGSYTSAVFFSNENSRYIDRFLPGLSQEKVDEIIDEYSRLYEERREQLRVLANEIAMHYCNKKVATDGTQFLNLAAKKEPLSIDQFESGEAVAAWLDTAELRFAYGPVSETYLYDSTAAKNMPKTSSSAFDTIDADQVYSLFMVFRSPAGRPVLACEVAPGNLHLYEVLESEFDRVMNSGRLQVIDYRYSPEFRE